MAKKREGHEIGAGPYSKEHPAFRPRPPQRGPQKPVNRTGVVDANATRNRGLTAPIKKGR